MSDMSLHDLARRFAKVNMGAAIVLDCWPELVDKPIYETCRELRGLNPIFFARWVTHVSDSVYSVGPQMGKLVRGAVKSFEKRIFAYPEKIDALTELCEKVEAFINRYR